MYEYASGLLRVLEKKLLDATDIDRMVNAPNGKEALNVLNDTDFADQLLNAREEEYERVTLDHLKAAKQLLSRISDNPFLFTFLFLEYDYHNMKVLFKKKFGHISAEPLLSDLAVYPCTALQEIIFEETQDIQFERGKGFIKDIEKPARAIAAGLGQTPTPSEIDLEVDKMFFGVRLKLAQKMKSGFLVEFAVMQIDSANVKIFLRSLKRKQENLKEFFTAHFIADGGIKLSDFLNALEHGNIELFFNDLKSFFVNYSFEHIFNNFLKHRQLWKLEQELDNFEMNFMKMRAKRAAISPSIIVGYYFAKLAAVKNIRLIMAGKLHGISAADIKERLRETY